MSEPSAGQCRSCRAMIYWVQTPAGKWMPVDLDLFWLRPDERGAVKAITQHGEVITGYRIGGTGKGAGEMLSEGAMLAQGLVKVGTSHYASCPRAASHRKKRSK